MSRKSMYRVAALAVVALVATFIIAAAQAAGGTDRFVAPGGTDAGDCSDGGAPCATIGYALSQAQPGDTIDIAAGTYTEQLDVNVADVTLDGAGIGQTIIQAPTDMVSEFATATRATNYPVVFPDADGVTVSNLTIDGRGEADTDGGHGQINHFEGVGTANFDGLTVDHVRIVNIRDNPLNGVQNGDGIYFRSDDGTARTLTISNSQIDQYQKNGITISGSHLTVDIHGNTVTGAGPTPSIAQNGIELVDLGDGADGPSGTISGNNVSGNECDDAAGGCGLDVENDTQSGGLLLLDAPNVTVSNNVFAANDDGIIGLLGFQAAVNGTDTIENNTFTGNRVVGIYGESGTYEITGNTIIGGEYGAAGISFGGDDFDTVEDLQGNTITGASIDGVFIDDQDQSDNRIPDVTMHFNAITGNATGIENEAQDTADAINNWFGCNGAPSDPGCDAVGGGTPVTSAPHLVLALTASPATLAPGGDLATLSASLRQNSSGTPLNSGTFPSGLTATFTTDLGTVTPSAPMSNGVAPALLASPATTGTAHLSATVANATATLSEPIETPSPPPTVTTTTTVTTTAPAPPPVTIQSPPVTVTTPAPVTSQSVSANQTAADGAAQALAGSGSSRLSSIENVDLFGKSSSLTLSSGGSAPVFALGCATGSCKVALKFQIRYHGAHNRLHTLNVPSQAISLKAGAAKLVRVQLTAAQRKLLRGATGLSLKVTIGVTDPTSHKVFAVSKTFPVKLASS